jgi:hemerythrin-like metal-binding protein
MPFVEWKDSYSVQHPEIDAQHRRLLDIINSLHEAMKMGGKPHELARVADDLVNYTRTHFTREEQIMRRAAYPDVEEHARKHRAMIAQVENFRGDLQSGKVAVSIQMMSFLKDWLTRHILDTDMRYKPPLVRRPAA